jgi:two-component system sensor histidine kinase ChiS
MYKENGYVLSWTSGVNLLMGDYPGAMGLFFIGFTAAVLLLSALIAFFRLFFPKRVYTPHESAWMAVSLSAIGVALGFCLPMVPAAAFRELGSKVQLLGLTAFETASAYVVFLAYHGEVKRERLFLLLSWATFCILFPIWGLVSGAQAIGGFSLLLLPGSGLCIFKARCRKQKYGGYVLLGGLGLVTGLAFAVAFPLPQILLWTAGVMAFFLAGNYLLHGPAYIFHAYEVADTVLPENHHEVSQAITPFVPKEFLSILNKDTVMDLQLGDHIKQEMTIFFSDIRQFTDLSENLSPEESFKFINSYLARIVPEIAANGGFVDKYVGDAIMALFPQEKGADMAVRTAIAIQKKLLEYNFHRASCGYRPLSMGIGLHTGALMLGVVGVEGRMQNTVISDAVNLASRLESITKVFNVSMAISEETFKKLEDPGSYMYRFIGKVRVKGKLEPVSVFEIFDGINPEIMERKMKANTYFEQGMLNYYQKRFSEALFNFQRVVEILPEDGASMFYLENCIARMGKAV